MFAIVATLKTKQSKTILWFSPNAEFQLLLLVLDAVNGVFPHFLIVVHCVFLLD